MTTWLDMSPKQGRASTKENRAQTTVTDEADDGRLKRFVVIAAAVLAAVAGFINSVFMTTLISPVSHVTGSLAQISADMTGGDLSGLWSLAMILFAFLAGAVAAGAVLGLQPQESGRRYGAALLLEAVLLGAAPLVVADQQDLIYAMALAAAACGLQNGIFSNYRGMVLRTSHMTGTLTDLGVLLGRRDYRNGQGWRGVLLLSTLVAFGGGGIVGAYGASVAGLDALWVPTLCCGLLGASYVLYRRRQHTTTAAEGYF